MDAWDVDPRDFPNHGLPEERLAFLLRWAVLAPSSHNSQPWRFRIEGDRVELFADRERSLPVVDPDDRELVISCGAALAHLEIALRHFGYRPDVELAPDGDRLAVVEAGARIEHVRARDPLFDAIPVRRTFRFPFAPKSLPLPLVERLEACARADEVWFFPVQADALRGQVAELVAEADREQMADAAFRKELAAWIHPNRSGHHDGIPGHALGLSDLASHAGALVVRAFDTGKSRAAEDRELVTEAPLLVALGTGGDAPLDWLRAGRAVARLLLEARAAGVYASWLNQAVEVPRLRRRLGHVLGAPGHPQLLLRLGYGRDVLPTPRRPVEEVLESAGVVQQAGLGA